jgi:hypothetical protein
VTPYRFPGCKTARSGTTRVGLLPGFSQKRGICKLSPSFWIASPSARNYGPLTVVQILRESIDRESRLHTDESKLYGGSKYHFDAP